MRARLLPILLVLASLLVLPGTLRADDEDDAIARLERRVELLLDLVAQLNAEVGALRERVVRLEAQLEGREIERVRAQPEAVPAVPIEPQPIVVFPDVSGLYDLDTAASVEAILAVQLRDVEDEEEREEIRASVTEEFEDLAITLRLEDGKFFVRMESMGAEHTARGTWERDVSHVGPAQRLRLSTTHEDGEESSHPERLVGTWERGRLTLREEGDGDADFVMVFVRR